MPWSSVHAASFEISYLDVGSVFEPSRRINAKENLKSSNYKLSMTQGELECKSVKYLKV